MMSALSTTEDNDAPKYSMFLLVNTWADYDHDRMILPLPTAHPLRINTGRHRTQRPIQRGHIRLDQLEVIRDTIDVVGDHVITMKCFTGL